MNRNEGEERAPLPEAVYEVPRGRVLLLAPHHDDDIIGPGGTMCLHRLAGDPVKVLVAFSGAAGDPDGRHEPGDYVQRRRAEAVRGGAHLGLDDYEFWDYPEGHAPSPLEVAAGARRLVELLRTYRPDVVYAPWIGEHHLDHHVLARVARLALAGAGFGGRAWGYEVWTPLIPTWVMDVSDVWDRKVAALLEHESQLELHDLVHKTLWLTAHRSIYLRTEARHGEGFCPLGGPSAEDRSLLERVS